MAKRTRLTRKLLLTAVLASVAGPGLQCSIAPLVPVEETTRAVLFELITEDG